LVSAQGVPNASMMGLPDGRKSFKIGLVVLIQYRLWQTPSHLATLP